MGNGRGLQDNFMSSLKDGLLNPLLERIKKDFTLDLQIRKNYINIYYRGGNILKVESDSEVVYIPHFEEKYYKRMTKTKSIQVIESLPQKLKSKNEVTAWVEAIPFLKEVMDIYFSTKSQNEREFQQLIVRENNFDSIEKGTDYYICDIEYKEKGAKNSGRFDMLAVKWKSTASNRKKTKDLGIAFIEVKYGDGSLNGKSGIVKHIKDMNDFLGDENNLKNIKEEMKCIFNQKKELGLIKARNNIDEIGSGKPEYIFIIANHDPESKKLKKALDEIKKLKYDNFDLKFAVSNFLGYGLFEENVYSLEEFRDRFSSQICNKVK